MALVRKILEATIPSGGSSATFTDSDIPNSLIRVYSTNSNIYPQNISLTGNTLTVTYEVVSSALGVAVELVKQGLEIDDNLTSDNTDHALSAKQGKVLKGLIDGLNIPDNISELQDVDITDIEDGQVLAWDETAEKFVNVDQSGGSSNNYSITETVVGTYDGKPLYRKMFTTPISTNNLLYGIIYNTGVSISPFISNVEQLFPILDHSWILINNTDIRGFLTLNNEDNTTIDCSTFYSRTGTAYITVEYTKTTD